MWLATVRIIWLKTIGGDFAMRSPPFYALLQATAHYGKGQTRCRIKAVRL